MKLSKNFDFCGNCRLSYNYPLMLVDDAGVLRVAGAPEDKCNTCNNCENCCRCFKNLVIPPYINMGGLEI